MAVCVALFIRGERGATAVEYGVIAAFVVLAIVMTLSFLGVSVLGMFNTALSAFG